MADDLQITPQGDEPSTGDSNESPAGYKFDPSQDTETANGNINLAGGETPEPIPGLIGASSEQEGEIIAPMKMESDVPSVEETSAKEPTSEEAETDTPTESTAETPADEESAFDKQEEEETASEADSSEEASEEVATEETPAEQSPKKKGISKAVLIGGALALAMLIGAGAYYGLGGLFKGELAAPSDFEVVQYPVAEEIKNLCPVDYYYDSETMSSTTLQLNENLRTQTSIERNFAARDYGKAQFMQISDSNLQLIEEPVLATTTTTTTTPIVQTDMLDTTTTVTTTTVTSDSTATTDLVKQPSYDSVTTIQDSTLLNDSFTGGNYTTTTFPDETTAGLPSYDLSIMDTSLGTTYDGQLGTSELSIADPTTEYTLGDLREGSDLTIADPSTDLTLGDLRESSDMSIASPSTDSTTFDPSWCQPIPQTDCVLLEKLLAEPSKYYISETTIMNMESWMAACRATPVQIVCGTNETMQRDGTCACDVGYFDISNSTQTDTAIMTDFIGPTSTLQCVNCDELNEIIRRKSAELDNPLLATDAAALEAEITGLKAIAAENCPVEETAPVREVVIVEEKSVCEQFGDNAEVLLARGDVRGSYDAAIEYIKNDCGRTYTDCEEYLAVAKVAKEYSIFSTTLSPASVSYFDEQYGRNRNAFYANPECVNTADLCVEVQSEPVINDRILTDTVEEPSVELLATDRIDSSSDLLRVGTTEEEPFTLDKLQTDVNYYISVKGIEDDKEKADYITRYCAEEVVIPREEPAPVRDVAPVAAEEPAPARVAVAAEEPAPARLVPIEVPQEDVASPPAPGTSDSQPTAVLAATDDQPVAGGSVSQPIAGGSVSSPSPETEEAAVASDTYVSSTTTTTTTTSTTETVSPDTTTPDLRPAAPPEPTLTPVDPAQPAPLITAETAPPDIYPVGPEVVMYAFALIASQLFFFRRRILEFVMNK